MVARSDAARGGTSGAPVYSGTSALIAPRSSSAGTFACASEISPATVGAPASSRRAFRARSTLGCSVRDAFSSLKNSSSYSFSPGRTPVNRTSMSSGESPERRIRSLARSTTFTGSPMSSTKTSPPSPITAAWSTSCTASGMVMKYRTMSGCVTVTGPPFWIWRRKVGMTLPAAAQHVSEADRDEATRAPRTDLLHDALGEALRRAHDARRANGLVGRDEDEALHAGPRGEIGDDLCAEHVVEDRLGNVLLHERHVLVRRRVEDHVRTDVAKHAFIRGRSRTSAMTGSIRSSGKLRASSWTARRSSSRRGRGL